MRRRQGPGAAPRWPSKIVNVLELPETVFAGPGIAERVMELGSGWRDEPLPGPDRDEFLAVG